MTNRRFASLFTLMISLIILASIDYNAYIHTNTNTNTNTNTHTHTLQSSPTFLIPGAEAAGCDNNPNTPFKQYDRCGVCGGSSSTCADCDGIPGSGKLTGDSNCTGCDNVFNSGKKFDICGVCGGNNASCYGCDGLIFSNKSYDACGICEGDNSTCLGCDMVPASGKVYDVCGVCGGDNGTCSGCDGVPFSNLVVDICGVCNGTNSTCTPVPRSGQAMGLYGSTMVIVGGENATNKEVGNVDEWSAKGEFSSFFFRFRSFFPPSFFRR
eukprot:TRINITY_DN513_c2_g2_i1.p1 TRINITY_DN513_c2_g2~~TRINITY_DN513_c2_g2_i1.p1  ORF type:complete len:268 (+),score=30.81 TRINITY_DN513_c2_g2_i1:119-922(+)